MSPSVKMPRASKIIVVLAVLAFSLWSPFVFGSNRPFLWAFNGLALSALVLFLLPFVSRAFMVSGLDRWGGLAFVVLALWIVGSIAMAFVFGPSDVAPQQTISASFRALEPLTSFSPSDSFLILIALISHALLWWTCVQLAREQWASLVLWCIFGVVCAYAVVAIANAYFDPIFILPAQLARGTDTGSTELAFINRNPLRNLSGHRCCRRTCFGLGCSARAVKPLANAQPPYRGWQSPSLGSRSWSLRCFCSSLAWV